MGLGSVVACVAVKLVVVLERQCNAEHARMQALGLACAVLCVSRYFAIESPLLSIVPLPPPPRGPPTSYSREFRAFFDCPAPCPLALLYAHALMEIYITFTQPYLFYHTENGRHDTRELAQLAAAARRRGTSSSCKRRRRRRSGPWGFVSDGRLADYDEDICALTDLNLFECSPDLFCWAELAEKVLCLRVKSDW